MNLNIEKPLYLTRLLRPSRYESLKLTVENSYAISETQSNFSALVSDVTKLTFLAYPKLKA